MKKIKVLVPAKSTWKNFGSPCNGFKYFYSDGYLFVICWGGTAYAKKCNRVDVDKIMSVIINAESEKEVNKVCGYGQWEYFN